MSTLIKTKYLFWIVPVFVFFFIVIRLIPAKSTCVNPFQVSDYTKNRSEIVQVCDDKIVRGDKLITTKKEYPDLFQFILNNEPNPTKQSVRVYVQQGKEYVAVTSTIDYTSWFSSAIGIYRKEDIGYKLIFKKPFAENPGRFSSIRFVPSDYSNYHSGIVISGDVGFLGCYGCRIQWIDYYDWDSKQHTYVIANNKHVVEFKKLLAEYQKTDDESCGNEDLSMAGISITKLYPTRKDKKGFCFDNAKVPFIEPGQAATFLKAKKAIEKVIRGDNISINRIKDIQI